MATEKKVETREEVYSNVAKLIVQYFGEPVDRYKEGLLVEQGEDTLIIRVIKKKSIPSAKEHIGTYDLEEDGTLVYTDLTEEKE